ncbi:MAG: glycosyltransferase family 2 protein [bacterium]
MKTEISVVIPTLNAEQEIGELLSCIRQQKDVMLREIIVVDSSSQDKSVAIAHEYGAQVIEIEQKDFNHGGTRNLGISCSTGEYIFLFTQDALPRDENYCIRMLESIRQCNAAGGYARQIPRPEASVLVKRDVSSWVSGSTERRIRSIESLGDFMALPPMERYLRCVFDNVASCIRRDVWERIPFPEVPFGEDLEWAYRVLVNGYTVVYEPDAAVVHSHERSADYIYKRTFVDHYRLYELFGLRTIPTLPHVLRSVMLTCRRDWSELLHHVEFTKSWYHALVSVPRYAWASAWGQYRGARAAASGEPVWQSREV